MGKSFTPVSKAPSFVDPRTIRILGSSKSGEQSADDQYGQLHIEKVQRLINLKLSGDYELEKIFGKEWIKEPCPTGYGAIFKQMVTDNRLANISVGPKKSNNHQTYIINHQVDASASQ
jgi:hypothetical protein